MDPHSYNQIGLIFLREIILDFVTGGQLGEDLSAVSPQEKEERKSSKKLFTVSIN